MLLRFTALVAPADTGVGTCERLALSHVLVMIRDSVASFAEQMNVAEPKIEAGQAKLLTANVDLRNRRVDSSKIVVGNSIPDDAV